jgi:hypothetical protein
VQIDATEGQKSPQAGIVRPVRAGTGNRSAESPPSEVRSAGTGLVRVGHQVLRHLHDIPQPGAPLSVSELDRCRMASPIVRRPRQALLVEPAFGLSGTHWPHPIALGSLSSPSDHHASCPGTMVT